MKEISSIVDEALLQARGFVLEAEAIEAGHSFGSNLSDSGSDPRRRTAIQTALTDALPQTVPGSHARAFIIAVVSALDDAWGQVI